VDPEQQAGGPAVLCKLLDFGIAFMKSEARLTQPGQVMGTPYYIAPESLRGGNAGPTMDVYSLAATMYEAFAGRPPFEGPTYTDILQMHVMNDPVPMRRHRPELPERLDQLLLRCLEKDPAKRPQTMREVAAELQAVQREIVGRARRSVPVAAVAASIADGSQTIGSGLAAWKEYLRTVVGKSAVLPPERRRQVHELEEAIAELEALDEDLKARRETLEEAEARAQAAEQRFARALEAMHGEEKRLQESRDTASKALDAAAATRREAETALADLRSRIGLLEGVGATGSVQGRPSLMSADARVGPADDELVEAFEAAGAAAAALREARSAERAARRKLQSVEAELADVGFQLERLVAAAESARPTVEFNRERTAIRTQEDHRTILWARLIDLASVISRG
jgi:hypothetical protein